MRRHEKEITDRSQIEAVVAQSRVCRLALSDGGQPYIVPLCFGYRDHRLYFHSAAEGRKIGILRRNPQVCFEFDLDAQAIPADRSCGWTMRYRSVIGFGSAEILEDPAEKHAGLEAIMRQYGDDGPHDFSEKGLENTVVIQVTITQMTGKSSGG